jgi:hypothetical protein
MLVTKSVILTTNLKDRAIATCVHMGAGLICSFPIPINALAFVTRLIVGGEKETPNLPKQVFTAWRNMIGSIAYCILHLDQRCVDMGIPEDITPNGKKRSKQCQPRPK